MIVSANAAHKNVHDRCHRLGFKPNCLQIHVFSFSVIGQGTCSCYPGGMYSGQNKFSALLLFLSDDCSWLFLYVWLLRRIRIVYRTTESTEKFLTLTTSRHNSAPHCIVWNKLL
jgi:hypothetical protein